MPVGTEKRKKKNSTKVNLVISLVFHGLILGFALYFAARAGLLGKQVKKIAVEMVREKKPEVKKEPEKPKPEQPKPETPKIAETPKVEAPKEAAAPPPAAAMAAPPAAAPPPAELAGFEFDGGKVVETTSDPVKLYKGMIENALQLNWDRPKDLDYQTNIAEVEVSVDKSGKLTDPVWKGMSGQKKWDDSVKMAVASTSKIIRPPPSNFPSRVTVRFDVEEATPVDQ